MKINITNVNGSYEFTGYILDENLSDKYLKFFEIDPNRDGCDEIKVSGEFSIEWDEEIPNVMVDYVVFSNGNKEIDVNLDDLNLEEIAEKITNKSNYMDWAADRISSQSDFLFDSYEDR